MSNSRKSDAKFPHAQRVCPWWLCFTFDNILRRLVQNPESILKPYIMPGWTVLDVGPGMGYFTIPMARLVGSSGKVFAADLQSKMLDALWRRAVRTGMQDRIRRHQTTQNEIGVKEPVDFCLAFWMLHEVRDRPRFIREIYSILKPEGLWLLAEPRLHVSAQSFKESIRLLKTAGLVVTDHPRIFFSYAVLLRKK
jgi:ubiquinone/menaquinone biosynthesis C-methylase UbiE